MSSIRIKLLLGWLFAGSVLIAINYYLDFREVSQRYFQTKSGDVTHAAAIFQGQLEFLYAERQLNQIQKSVADLGGIKHVSRVYLLDDKLAIVAASQIAVIGEELSKEMENASYQQVIERFALVKANSKTRLWFSHNKMDMYVLTPVYLGRQSQTSVRSDKIGGLLIQVDMSWVNQSAHYLVQSTLVIKIVLMLSVVFLTCWLLSSHIVLRLRAIAGLVKTDGSQDEIAQIADGFNQLQLELQQQKSWYEERHQRIVKSLQMSRVGSWDLDLATQELHWSEEVFDIFGLDFNPDDLTQEKFYDAVHPDDIEHINEMYINSLGAEEGFYELEHRIIHQRTGEVRYVYEHCVHITDNAGKTVHSLGVIQDITERYVAQQALVEKQAELNAMLEIMADGMVTIDETGIVCSFNQRAEGLFGYQADEIIGQNVSMLMPRPFACEHDQYISRFIATGEAKIIGTGREVEGLHRDGRRFAMHLSVAELPSKVGEKRRFIGSCMDLTDIKQKEEIIARSQKMDALGKLTGGIAHDFNNMLGVILGYAQLLKDQLEDQPKFSRYADQIYHAGERGAKLTGKLLSFSRRRATSLTCCNLNQLIDNEADVLRKSLTARVRLELQLHPLVWTVKLDESGFEDMLLNLTINAMHAIEGNGKLTIKTDNISLTQMQASELELSAGDYVCLSVKDTGCGMDNHVLSKIFDPFYTTKGDGGTGLGLSQVYGFVRASNGSIQVLSQVGVGTDFVIYFPREMVSLDSDAKADELSILDTSGSESILVVDDEESLTQVAESILSSNGYQVYTATCAVDALKLLEQHSIDLMLTDVIMPVTNGYQLAKMVNERYPHVLVRLVSGFSGHANEPDSDLPLDEPIIAKPYTAIELTRALRVQLNKQLVMEMCYEQAQIKEGQPLHQKWKQNTGSSFEQLDEDHFELFDIFYQCTKLEHQSMADELRWQQLDELFTRLFTYCDKHFMAEEAVMATCQYPYFENHRRVHQNLIEQLQMARDSYHEYELQAWLQATLADWLSEHVMVMDKAVYPFMLKHREDIEQVLLATAEYEQ